MVEFKNGVVKFKVLLPPLKITPPEDASYQSTVSPTPAPVTLKFIVPEPQILSPIPIKLLFGTELTIASTGILLALTQPVVLFLNSA